MNQEDIEKILKAGEISVKVKNNAKKFIKKGLPLLDIAEKIEAEIIELGGKPGFPVNLDIDEVAAHYTPSHDDSQVARGLLKVDIGVSVDGWVSDSAFSMDLEDNEENKKLIESTETAIEKIEKTLKSSPIGSVTTGQIGKITHETAESFEFNPIINLSGHQIEQYDLHAGINIPNVDDNSLGKLSKGYYAIEPFITNGNGKIKDGAPSNIYLLISEKNVRNPNTREVLKYIIEEYQTLPFASRWIVKKFGVRALLAIKQLESNGNIHSYAQLIEVSGGKVAQTEHDFLITDKEVIVTTKKN